MADDYPASTATTGVVNVGGSIAGNSESIPEGDWFRFTLTAGHLYQFDLDGKDFKERWPIWRETATNHAEAWLLSNA
jgi:hypothetical protein